MLAAALCSSQLAHAQSTLDLGGLQIGEEVNTYFSGGVGGNGSGPGPEMGLTCSTGVTVADVDFFSPRSLSLADGATLCLKPSVDFPISFYYLGVGSMDVKNSKGDIVDSVNLEDWGGFAPSGAFSQDTTWLVFHTDGNPLYLNSLSLGSTVVPEPGTAAFLAAFAGMGGTLLLRRRRK
jgi:hypothetical protein